MIVIKHTKAVSYDEILEHPELQHPFSTMASILTEFVKNHWLIFDETEFKSDTSMYATLM